MASKRLNRDEFFDRLAEMDQAGLKKALWTLYWRGSAPMRERIEVVIDPSGPASAQLAKARTDPSAVLTEVAEFAALARKGAFLAGDRRVSPKERTRWRHTFKRLVSEATEALGGDDVESAASALATLIDLACETRRHDYFRSDDPMEAARFVVSDAAAALWTAILHEQGFVVFSERAAGQLVRWESRYGWTRRGDGVVSEREGTLARVVAGLLPAADAWGRFADDYLRALDRAAEGGRRGGGKNERAEELSEWHSLLVERLVDGEYDDRLDVLVGHPALAGPEQTFVLARLSERRGDRDQARQLIRQCLKSLPGHRGFLAFAEEVGA